MTLYAANGQEIQVDRPELGGLREAAAMLAELERLAPITIITVPQAHHSIDLDKGQLRVTIWVGRQPHAFYLDDADLGRPGSEVARMLLGMIQR